MPFSSHVTLYGAFKHTTKRKESHTLQLVQACQTGCGHFRLFYVPFLDRWVRLITFLDNHHVSIKHKAKRFGSTARESCCICFALWRPPAPQGGGRCLCHTCSSRSCSFPCTSDSPSCSLSRERSWQELCQSLRHYVTTLHRRKEAGGSFGTIFYFTPNPTWIGS